MCKENKNQLLDTIIRQQGQRQQQQQAGGDLELSVSSVREKMAERHRRVLIILLEYQWNRKRNSSPALTEGYFCSAEADAHFSVPQSEKPCWREEEKVEGGEEERKKNKEKHRASQLALVFVSVCSSCPHCEITLIDFTSHLPKVQHSTQGLTSSPPLAPPPSPSPSSSSLDYNHSSVSLLPFSGACAETKKPPWCSAVRVCQARKDSQEPAETLGADLAASPGFTAEC